jgi:hypothetical protein
MVNRRLLVSDSGRVEIAHEALLRTWQPLVEWIEEGRWSCCNAGACGAWVTT